MKLSIGKAWEESAIFLGREARLVVPVALALFAFPSTLFNWAYPPSATPTAGGLATLGLLAMIVAALIGQMTLILLVLGWRNSIGEALGKGARRVPVLLGAAMIVFVPIVILVSIVLGGLMVGAGITDPASMTPQVMVKSPAIAWLVLVTFGLMVFIGVRLLPMSAVAVFETVGPVALLKRSWTLTKGQFWRLLALVLLLSVGLLVLSAAVQWVVGSIAAVMLGEARPFNLAALVVALASGIVGALVSGASAALVGRIYAQLVSDAPIAP